MLQIRNLSYSIGELELIKLVDWIINPGRRIGLIGKNGAGKTTLLRIIMGELENSFGTILKPKEYTIGYLPQEVIDIKNAPILSCTLEGNQELIDIEAQIFKLHELLEQNSNNQDHILKQLGDLESQYSVLGGYELESIAKKILTGLGFKPNELHRPISEFSGGWRMRVYLAKILLQNPNLLLLDEPTNHLDLESLEWLENYLRSFSGSMIVVSHDRFFIDRLAQEIAELENGRLTLYAGNYHFYENKKALYRSQILKHWEQQKEERQRIQRFIDRFRYKASKAAQVQSRIKLLEKMETIELPPERQRIKFKIQADVISYKDVLNMENVAFQYADDWVLNDINLQIQRGEKIALVGINGAGKTTLTRIINDELHPQKGSIKIGERVNIGYYAQHQVDSLNHDNSIIEEVAYSAANSFRTRLRDILGIFQFSGEEVEKPISVLSGGEKARVSLAKILLSPCNFLIMDEPTNHLDLISKEALEEALAEYDGTLLIIAHDRYFLDKLVSRVIEIRQGRIFEYLGSYTDYLNRREDLTFSDNSDHKTKNSFGSKQQLHTSRKSKEQKRKEAEARQAVSKERNRLQKNITEIESRIDQLFQKKKSIEQDMANPLSYENPEQIAIMKKDYVRIEAELQALETQWEKKQLKYEAIIKELNE
jgi:ATP-binding cassette subfamily F protein 3